MTHTMALDTVLIKGTHLVSSIISSQYHSLCCGAAIAWPNSRPRHGLSW